MYIKRIKINNFRGIKELNKEFDNRLICLIGNSDSTKTTILDAIELCLYPYWTIQITDTDFYNCNIDENIVIQLTIGDIPERLLTEEKYGLYIRKDVDESQDDEPTDSDDKFITIELRINEMFECKWSVINNRSDGKPISHKDRAEFNVARIGENINKDFKIGKNSILKHYIDDINFMDSFLIDTIRDIKEIKITDSKVKESLKTMESVIESYSVKLNDELKINIELKNSDIGLSNLNLCDGIIPIHSKGTGTKRLVSSILNINKLENSACILIDEIEYGLEPHKLSELLYKLKKNSKTNGQVIMTTHSPITIAELEYNNLILCKSKAGITNCTSFDKTIQPLLRSNSFAFITNKIIIVEGATENGLLRTLNKKWSDYGESLSMYNSLVMDGKGGTQACNHAKKLNDMGYKVCVLIDSDDGVALKKAEEIERIGIKVFKWEDGNSTEKQILKDLPKESLNDIINMMIELKKDERAVKNYINDEFGIETINIEDLSDFTVDEIKEKLVKILTFKNSEGKDRFKSINYGIALGEIIEQNYDKLESNTIKNVINNLKEWYKEDE